MKNIFTIIKRELGSYFNSAIAYIYLIVFIAINNSLFMARFFLLGKADMKEYFDSLPMMLFIFIPAISMRLWAEDKKEHTFELLMTLPMKPQELVLGKFFAGLIFYSIALLSTITVPLTVYLTGTPDSGSVLGGYIGSLFMGGLFLAIGIFISGLAQEQIVAFVLGTLSCFVVFFLGVDFVASFLDGWLPGFGSFLSNYVGAASHLSSFTKGVIDIRDVLYFVVTSSVFLLLNGLFLEGRFRPRAKIIFSTACLFCFVGVVAFNWLVHDFNAARFDLTENKSFTVSEATKKIFKELKVPVSLNFYITPSEKMPTAFKSLEADIVGKLQELKVASGNKFNFKVLHIEAARLMEQNSKDAGSAQDKGSSLERSLQEKGIVPFQVESVDRDELGVKLVYSAITINYKEKKEEILPRILPANVTDLEYLLFSRILKLTSETKPKIALYSPLKTEEITPEVNRLLSELGQNKPQYEDQYKTIVPLLANNGYEANRISLSKDSLIPEGTNLLLVVNPGPLNDRQIFELNKFLFQGGSVLIAAQGYEYQFQMTPPSGINIAAEKKNLDIDKLIKPWGISIDKDILFDESNQMIQITSGQKVGPFALSMPVKIPNQITVDSSGIEKGMPLVSRLSSLFYLWGSALDISEETVKQSGLKKSLMFFSSSRSWKVPYTGASLNKEVLNFPASGSPGRFPLAVMLEGQFSNTFAQKDFPDWPSAQVENQKQEAKKEEKAVMLNPKPGKLIVIGCSKMFNDDLIPNPGNLGLFSNIIDGVTLGNDIVKIRSKTYTSREIKKVSDSQKIFYRFLTIIFVPTILAVYAALRLILRKKEKQFYSSKQEK